MQFPSTLTPDSLIHQDYMLTRVPANWDTDLAFRQLLTRDIYSEVDSRHLYKEFTKRNASYSGNMIRLMQVWQYDELCHYEYLRRVYHVLSGESYESMDRIAASRTPDYDSLDWVLNDPLTFLLCLAFDECGSMLSYRQDLRQYYALYGGAIHRIGTRLVQDEGKHYRWFIDELLRTYSTELTRGLVKGVLDKLIAHEHSSASAYKAEFILDHAQELDRFSEEFDDVVKEIILADLRLGFRPTGLRISQAYTLAA